VGMRGVFYQNVHVNAMDGTHPPPQPTNSE